MLYRICSDTGSGPDPRPRTMLWMTLTLCLTIVPFFGPARICGADPGLNRTLSTRIVIHKALQVLELWENGFPTRMYRVCLGEAAFGPKTITGDKKTPEGEYYICFKNKASKFHRFLGISYPGIQDAQAAFERGVISLDVRDSIIRKIERKETPPWNTKLGGWVGIHGYPTDLSFKLWTSLLLPKPHNWTDGCVAVWSYEIEDLYARVPLRTPVTILP